MEWIKLDLQLFAGEKTEKATPKKRQDSRKKGQVAKSQDVNTAIVLLAVFLTLLFAGQFFFLNHYSISLSILISSISV